MVPSGSLSLFWVPTHQVFQGHSDSQGPLVFGCSPGSHHMSLLRLLVSEGGPWSILTLIHSRLNPQVRASLSRPKAPAYHGLAFQGSVQFPLGPAFLSLLVPWEWAQVRPQPSPRGQWLNGLLLPFQATIMEPRVSLPRGW